MNMEKRLPVLMSWSGGFTLVRITEIAPRYLTLELRYHPNDFHGRQWVVWCRRARGELHFKGELVWCLGLPARTETTARMMFAEIQAQLEYKRRPSENRAIPEKFPALTESQMRFLAKQYPRTIGFFRALCEPAAANEITRLHEEMSRAFVEETFACRKVLLEPVDDEDQLLRMGCLFAKMAARERKADPVEYELIAGCHAKGYCRMKLADLQEAIGRTAGYKPTIDALRQKWKRLGLPSERKRGHPNSSGK